MVLSSFGGDATEGSDYTGPASGGEVVWRAVSFVTQTDRPPYSRDATYTIVADNMAEDDETITFTLPTLMRSFSTDTFTTTSTNITINIRANDADNRYAPPSFAIASGVSVPANEGDTAVFRVTLSGSASAGAVTVNWDVSGVDTSDWSSTTPNPLRFTEAGTLPINILIEDDELREDDPETLTVTISSPSDGTINTASATATIAASDARTLTVTGPSTLTETDGNEESGNYTIALSGSAFPRPPTSPGRSPTAAPPTPTSWPPATAAAR